jgi:hypothetical protein
LEKKLATVQKKALGGRAPTAELTALWAHGLQKKDNAFFGSPTYGEVSLVASGDTGSEGYLSGANAEVWEALFREISWIGEEADGGLVGYYHRGAKSLDGAPIVYLDNEGLFHVTGLTLVDHFAWRREGEDENGELDAFCDSAKLPKPLPAKKREAAVKSIASPGIRLAELEKAAKKTSKASGVRAVSIHPTAVRLNDGRVLIISPDDPVNESEPGTSAAFLFDPSSATFARTADAPCSSRWWQGAGTLEDGRAAFVVSKSRSHPQEDRSIDQYLVVLFDPKTGQWTSCEALENASHEGGRGVALLPSGRVLIAGGEYSYGSSPSDVVSLFEVASKTWRKGGKLSVKREHPAVVVLGDGRALVIGGTTDARAGSRAVDAIDAKGAVTAVAPLPQGMERPKALLLSDGRVAAAATFSMERGKLSLYDPKKNKWSPVIEHDDLGGPMVQLADGRIACFSDNWKAPKSVVIVDLATLKCGRAGETLVPHGWWSVVSRVADDRVLAVGGDLFSSNPSEPEMWDPQSGEGTPIAGFEKQVKKQQQAWAKHAAKRR